MKHLDIKRALADHNMTQVQLGEKMNVQPQSLTSVIKGNPTVKKLEDIATAIGCDITDLFYPDHTEAAEKEKKEEINMKPLGMDVIKQIADRVPDVIGGNSGSSVDWANVENAENGEEMQQQMIQTSTFCPHCGKKVRVGVVLLPEEE